MTTINFEPGNRCATGRERLARIFALTRAAATLIAAVLLLGIDATVSYAQQPIPARVPVVPREQLRPDLTQPRPAPEVGERPELEATPRPELSPEAAAIKFTLNTLTISGATVYDVAEFEPLYQEFVGTEVTLQTLRDIADRIEAKYRGDEYVATRALVPAQRITEGAVEIRIVEGVIRNIIVRGDIGPSDKLVRRYLAKLRTGEPLRWPDAERYLLLARDVPGLSLTGTLRKTPGVEVGGVDLIVDVAHKQFEGFANIQNYSAEATGPWTLSGGASMNNPLGYGDQLQGVALVTIPDFEEQYVGQIGYQARFGSEGLASHSLLSYSLSKPTGLLAGSDTEETALIFDTRLEYPVFRSRGLNLWTALGFEYVDQETEFAGTTITDDKLRVLYGRATWAVSAPFSTVFEGRADVRVGLDILGANDEFPASRLDGNKEFVLGRVDMSTTTPLVAGFSLYLRGMGQVSDSPLLSYEEFALGNLTLGRSFDPGEISGDDGIAGTVELRLNRPEFRNDWVNDTQFFVFADGGKIWNQPGDLDEEEELNSVGGGVRVRVQDTYLGELTFAHPTNDGSSLPTLEPPSDTVLLRFTKLF